MTNESYNPTPDEIAAACAEIQSTWSAEERMTRLERMPPLQESDYVGIEAMAAVRLEDRLQARREALASGSLG